MPAYPWTKEFDPVAAPQAVFTIGPARFTVLTSRLIRLELDPAARFEDRPSTAFWRRNLPVPPLTVQQTPTKFTLQTEHLRLEYDPRPAAFNHESLRLTLLESKTTWRPGAHTWDNLGGTARTLDEAAGRIRLEKGLISRAGWSVVDDSESLVFDDDGWITPRSHPETDWYFFGYAHDYFAALAEFTEVAGKIPLLPRWALGNWWSRYWPYTQAELTGVMEEFIQHGAPLSVCIIDMDWHITRTGNTSTGWTGYTWNRDLFPDHVVFLTWLHAHGLKTSMNLHPAEGIHPHEEAYPAMARRMGIDPASNQPVPFDIPDQKFAAAYFEILHHPMEAEGVDFWWIDWQQGDKSKMPGLDPLFWLNHLHWYDLARNPQHRPFLFSRWGGLGNHRYQIGFSGDSHCTWDALSFQPYFTATASNVGYCWWSHDIGGHQRGTNDPELYLRWVQYGVFSPILRLHSTCNPWIERRPWGFDAETEQQAVAALRLRHQFIPYLYTASWIAHEKSIPPILPLYYLAPEEPDAYECSQTYTFGPGLIAAPFTSPRDPETRLARQAVWLPEGDWYDFWTGEKLACGWRVVHGGLRDIPLFARAGALIPLAADAAWNEPGNPATLHLHAFAGADGDFDLYEDDGASMSYLDGARTLTHISLRQVKDALHLKISGTAPGDLLPARRTWVIHMHGVGECDRVTLNGSLHPFEHDPKTECATLTVENPTDEDMELVFDYYPGGRSRRAENVRKLLAAFCCDVDVKRDLNSALPAILDGELDVRRFSGRLTNAQYAALCDIL